MDHMSSKTKFLAPINKRMNFSIRPVMDNESTIQWIIWHNPLGFGFWWRIKIFVWVFENSEKNRKNHKNNKIDV